VKRTSVVLILLVQIAWAQSLGSFFKQTFDERLRDDWNSSHRRRHEYEDRWTDCSATGRAQRRAHLERRLEQLNGFPSASLSGQDRLTVRLLQYDFRSQIEAFEVETHLVPAGLFVGFYNNVYRVIDRMPARTVHDYENLLARLRAVPAGVDQERIQDEIVERGTTQPRVVVDLVADQFAAQIRQDSGNTLRGVPRFHLISPGGTTRARTAAAEAYDSSFQRGINTRTENKWRQGASAQVSSMTGGRLRH
jgi:uncharacterized protein (DUF885 family)